MSTKLCPLQKFTVCQKQCAWLTEDNVCSMLQLAKVFSPPKSRPATQEDREAIRRFLGGLGKFDKTEPKGSSSKTNIFSTRSLEDFIVVDNRNHSHANEDCHHTPCHDTNCHDHHD